MVLSQALRRDILLGSVAGVIGGLVFAWALSLQGMMGETAGLLGFSSVGAGVLLHLATSAAVGASFGALFRYHPDKLAATISLGVIYGLVWWILGPLTVSPILMGRSPTWEITEAGASFLNLVGHVVYGGVTGLSFYALGSLYLRRKPKAAAKVAAPDRPMHRVVILGGGFAGITTAQRLERLTARRGDVQITLVSDTNFLLFTPMLAEVASSALEAQHISAPIRASCPHTIFFRGSVESIDTDQQTVRVRAAEHLPPEDLSYDHLVLTLGAVPAYYDLPGLEDRAFTLKTLEDATRLRNHVLAMMERADVESDPEERRRQLTFVAVGAGFAGTEVMAELFDMARSVLPYYPRIEPEEIRFMVVHSGDRILPELSPELAEYCLRILQARGIEFRLETRVSGATDAAVLLQGVEPIQTRTIVWTAGNQPNPIIATMSLERDRRGAVIAQPTLQAQGFKNVWVAGDCAAVPDPDNDGRPYPPTAQHALREGRLVAENVVAVLGGGSPRDFRFRTLGLMLALGHRTAAAELLGRRFSGFLAWMMWRTIYLGKLPGIERKVRVLLDWILDVFFPRDIVLTGDTAAPAAAGSPEPDREGDR
ncbi:MAG: NAD(P)/FAD-dependent oxidoreductase [Anaerolineae bacterium]